MMDVLIFLAVLLGCVSSQSVKSSDNAAPGPLSNQTVTKPEQEAVEHARYNSDLDKNQKSERIVVPGSGSQPTSSEDVQPFSVHSIHVSSSPSEAKRSAHGSGSSKGEQQSNPPVFMLSSQEAAQKMPSRVLQQQFDSNDQQDAQQTDQQKPLPDSRDGQGIGSKQLDDSQRFSDSSSPLQALQPVSNAMEYSTNSKVIPNGQASVQGEASSESLTSYKPLNRTSENEPAVSHTNSENSQLGLTSTSGVNSSSSSESNPMELHASPYSGTSGRSIPASSVNSSSNPSTPPEPDGQHTLIQNKSTESSNQQQPNLTDSTKTVKDDVFHGKPQWHNAPDADDKTSDHFPSIFLSGEQFDSNSSVGGSTANRSVDTSNSTSPDRVDVKNSAQPRFNGSLLSTDVELSHELLNRESEPTANSPSPSKNQQRVENTLGARMLELLSVPEEDSSRIAMDSYRAIRVLKPTDKYEYVPQIPSDEAPPDHSSDNWYHLPPRQDENIPYQSSGRDHFKNFPNHFNTFSSAPPLIKMDKPDSYISIFPDINSPLSSLQFVGESFSSGSFQFDGTLGLWSSSLPVLFGGKKLLMNSTEQRSDPSSQHVSHSFPGFFVGSSFMPFKNTGLPGDKMDTSSAGKEDRPLGVPITISSGRSSSPNTPALLDNLNPPADPGSFRIPSNKNSSNNTDNSDKLLLFPISIRFNIPPGLTFIGKIKYPTSENVLMQPLSALFNLIHGSSQQWPPEDLRLDAKIPLLTTRRAMKPFDATGAINTLNYLSPNNPKDSVSPFIPDKSESTGSPLRPVAEIPPVLFDPAMNPLRNGNADYRYPSVDNPAQILNSGTPYGNTPLDGSISYGNPSNGNPNPFYDYTNYDLNPTIPGLSTNKYIYPNYGNLIHKNPDTGEQNYPPNESEPSVKLNHKRLYPENPSLIAKFVRFPLVGQNPVTRNTPNTPVTDSKTMDLVNYLNPISGSPNYRHPNYANLIRYAPLAGSTKGWETPTAALGTPDMTNYDVPIHTNPSGRIIYPGNPSFTGTSESFPVPNQAVASSLNTPKRLVPATEILNSKNNVYPNDGGPSNWYPNYRYSPLSDSPGNSERTAASTQTPVITNFVIPDNLNPNKKYGYAPFAGSPINVQIPLALSGRQNMPSYNLTNNGNLNNNFYGNPDFGYASPEDSERTNAPGSPEMSDYLIPVYKNPREGNPSYQTLHSGKPSFGGRVDSFLLHHQTMPSSGNIPNRPLSVSENVYIRNGLYPNYGSPSNQYPNDETTNTGYYASLPSDSNYKILYPRNPAFNGALPGSHSNPETPTTVTGTVNTENFIYPNNGFPNNQYPYGNPKFRYFSVLGSPKSSDRPTDFGTPYTTNNVVTGTNNVYPKHVNPNYRYVPSSNSLDNSKRAVDLTASPLPVNPNDRYPHHGNLVNENRLYGYQNTDMFDGNPTNMNQNERLPRRPSSSGTANNHPTVESSIPGPTITERPMADGMNPDYTNQIDRNPNASNHSSGYLKYGYPENFDISTTVSNIVMQKTTIPDPRQVLERRTVTSETPDLPNENNPMNGNATAILHTQSVTTPMGNIIYRNPGGGSPNAEFPRDGNSWSSEIPNESDRKDGNLVYRKPDSGNLIYTNPAYGNPSVYGSINSIPVQEKITTGSHKNPETRMTEQSMVSSPNNGNLVYNIPFSSGNQNYDYPDNQQYYPKHPSDPGTVNNVMMQETTPDNNPYYVNVIHRNADSGNPNYENPKYGDTEYPSKTSNNLVLDTAVPDSRKNSEMPKTLYMGQDNNLMANGPHPVNVIYRKPDAKNPNYEHQENPFSFTTLTSGQVEETTPYTAASNIAERRIFNVDIPYRNNPKYADMINRKTYSTNPNYENPKYENPEYPTFSGTSNSLTQEPRKSPKVSATGMVNDFNSNYGFPIIGNLVFTNPKYRYPNGGNPNSLIPSYISPENISETLNGALELNMPGYINTPERPGTADGTHETPEETVPIYSHPKVSGTRQMPQFDTANYGPEIPLTVLLEKPMPATPDDMLNNNYPNYDSPKDGNTKYRLVNIGLGERLPAFGRPGTNTLPQSIIFETIDLPARSHTYSQPVPATEKLGSPYDSPERPSIPGSQGNTQRFNYPANQNFHNKPTIKLFNHINSIPGHLQSGNPMSPDFTGNADGHIEFIRRFKDNIFYDNSEPSLSSPVHQLLVSGSERDGKTNPAETPKGRDLSTHNPFKSDELPLSATEESQELRSGNESLSQPAEETPTGLSQPTPSPLKAGSIFEGLHPQNRSIPHPSQPADHHSMTSSETGPYNPSQSTAGIPELSTTKYHHPMVNSGEPYSGDTKNVLSKTMNQPGQNPSTRPRGTATIYVIPHYSTDTTDLGASSYQQAGSMPETNPLKNEPGRSVKYYPANAGTDRTLNDKLIPSTLNSHVRITINNQPGESDPAPYPSTTTTTESSTNPGFAHYLQNQPGETNSGSSVPEKDKTTANAYVTQDINKQYTIRNPSDLDFQERVALSSPDGGITSYQAPEHRVDKPETIQYYSKNTHQDQKPGERPAFDPRYGGQGFIVNKFLGPRMSDTTIQNSNPESVQYYPGSIQPSRIIGERSQLIPTNDQQPSSPLYLSQHLIYKSPQPLNRVNATPETILVSSSEQFKGGSLLVGAKNAIPGSVRYYSAEPFESRSQERVGVSSPDVSHIQTGEGVKGSIKYYLPSASDQVTEGGGNAYIISEQTGTVATPGNQGIPGATIIQTPVVRAMPQGYTVDGGLVKGQNYFVPYENSEAAKNLGELSSEGRNGGTDDPSGILGSSPTKSSVAYEVIPGSPVLGSSGSTAGKYITYGTIPQALNLNAAMPQQVGSGITRASPSVPLPSSAVHHQYIAQPITSQVKYSVIPTAFRHMTKYGHTSGDMMKSMIPIIASLPKGMKAGVTRGKYSYTGPDGKLVTTNWYVDETGFHIEGDEKAETHPTEPKNQLAESSTSSRSL